jgi:hypothetical protein
MPHTQPRRSAFAPVGDAIRDLQAAEVRLRHEQEVVWRKYLAEVDQILATDLRRDDELDQPDEQAHALFDGIRGRLDDLRVQVKLGTMEGEDLLQELRQAISQLTGQIHLPR